MTVVEPDSSADELMSADHGSVDVIVTASPTVEPRAALSTVVLQRRNNPDRHHRSRREAHSDVYGRATTFGGGLEGLTALIREAAAGARPRIGG